MELGEDDAIIHRRESKRDSCSKGVGQMLSQSQFAHELKCLHCGQSNPAAEWRALGDLQPFYYQAEPGRYNLTMTCPHCQRVWYVVWDDDPGPLASLAFPGEAGPGPYSKPSDENPQVKSSRDVSPGDAARFCPFCKQSLAEYQRYCDHCQADWQLTCRKCGELLPERTVFCRRCNTDNALPKRPRRFCPWCGYPLTWNSQTCPRCEREEAPSVGSVVTCPVCKASLPRGAANCTSCHTDCTVDDPKKIRHITAKSSQQAETPETSTASSPAKPSPGSIPKRSGDSAKSQEGDAKGLARSRPKGGHVPRASRTQDNKPACFLIFGNGFTPSEGQAMRIILAWTEKRKGVLGEDAAVGVRSELRHHPAAPRTEFVEVVAEVRENHPGQVTDDILWLDQKTGRDMALIAVWTPEASAYVGRLLKEEKKDSEGTRAARAASAARPPGPSEEPAASRGAPPTKAPGVRHVDPAATRNKGAVIACPSCDQTYQVPDAILGKAVTCKKCGQRFAARGQPSGAATQMEDGSSEPRNDAHGERERRAPPRVEAAYDASGRGSWMARLLDRLLSPLLGAKQERLVSACWKYRTDRVTALLKAGADPNAKSAKGITPLVAATAGEDHDFFSDMLSARIQGGPASEFASRVVSRVNTLTQEAKLELVEVLLRAGADPNVQTPVGTAIYHAAAQGAAAIVDMLLAAGADPNPGPKRSVFTPLAFAVLSGNTEVARTLLKAGANPDGRKGFRPLFAAVAASDLSMVQLLLHGGANPHARGGADGTHKLLDLANEVGNQDVISAVRRALSSRPARR